MRTLAGEETMFYQGRFYRGDMKKQEVTGV